MKRILGIGFAALLAVAVAVAPAHAGLVTSITGGNLVMPAVNYFGPGPQPGGPGYTWSSTNAGTQGGSAFGYTGGYGFGANGGWDGTLGPMAGVNDAFFVYGATDTMTFEFASPVFNVGGFINYYPDFTTPTTIAVWDSSIDPDREPRPDVHDGRRHEHGPVPGLRREHGDHQVLHADRQLRRHHRHARQRPALSTPDGGATVTLLGSALLGLGMLRRKFRR